MSLRAVGGGRRRSDASDRCLGGRSRVSRLWRRGLANSVADQIDEAACANLYCLVRW